MLLDYLLVNPNNRIVSPFAAIESPLWTGLIAGWYRSGGDYQRKFWGTKGTEVKILDAEAEDLTLSQTINRIKALNPAHIILVVMGNNPACSSTPKMVIAEELYKLISKDIPTTFTGLHPQAVKRVNTFHLNLTSMPSIPWELLSMDKYRAHNWHCLDGSSRSPYGVVYTSLGCPFDCSFCNIHALYGGQHKVWYREPEEVAQEIDRLVNEYEVRNIKFWDELFTLNQQHVEEICNRLISRHYNLNIWAYARVDTINPDILVRMKEAGINWLAYGFESGSDKILAESNKRASKVEAIKAVNMTHNAGINIIGNFMFGLPGDTEETMQETLEFAKSLELEFINFYVAKAYPGSKIYENNKDWASYNQFGEDNDKITQFRDKAFIEFFTDRSYLARIKGRFGWQAVEQIHNMLEFGKPVTRSN